MNFTLEEILQRISKVMPGEYRQDLTFRLLIASSEYGDTLSHVTHDTRLNPPARPFSKEDKRLTHGQVYVQLFAAAEMWQPGLVKSAVRKFIGDVETDELSVLVMLAQREALHYSVEQLALQAYIAGARFIERLAPYAEQHTLAEIGATTAEGAYKLLMFTCGCSIDPYEAIELGLKNWEDYDWKRREAQNNKSGELSGLGFGHSVEGQAYVIQKNLKEELDKVPRNVILVVPEGAPDLISVVNKVFGIVSDQGGKTSHIANICRPANIPYVTGVGDATKKIKTGDDISLVIDGEAGKVTYKPAS